MAADAGAEGAAEALGPHAFHPTLLRAYDARGIVGETLTEADTRALGAALGTLVRRAGGAVVCVGYDGRISSPALATAAEQGLAATGIRVLRVGLGPSPMLYEAVKTLGADAGLMITGSHNPPEYNGCKMLLKDRPIYGDDMAVLGRLAAAGDFEQGPGTIETVERLEAYVARLAAAILDDPALAEACAGLRVVWDAGNGAAGEAMRLLADRLPGHHRLLYAEIDGRFPNHHPDPTLPETLADLRRAVAEDKAHLGVAFDGDGDRLGAVDGAGRILWGDQLMMLFAREVLAAHPGAPVIADVKASQTLFDDIARLGGRPVMGQTGHSLMKVRMKETGALLAGEMSGHLFFADRYDGFDDALYAAVRLLALVARLPNQDLAAAHAALPTAVNTPELRFPCAEDDKARVMAAVAARLEAEGPAAGEVCTLDGLRVTTPAGWWLLRPSNTQAVLVARCEGPTEADLETVKAALAGHLEAVGVPLPD